MPVDLSVVIPAYNEAGRLPATLEQVIGYLQERALSYEVLVVDDGSADATAEVAGEYARQGVWVLKLATNRGKGAALRHGVVASEGERVLLTDADLSTPIGEVAKLEARLAAGADVVLGSRAVEGAAIGTHQPWHREALGRMFNLFLRLLGVPFRDTQCGFKLLRGEVARELFPRLTVAGYAYDVELVLRALAESLRVEEVGVTWNDSPVSRVRPWRDGMRMVADTLRVRWGEGARRGAAA